MSSFGVIKKGNIYKDQEFYDQPYTETDRFAVYIPKQSSKIVDVIEKEKQKTANQQQNYQNFRPQQRPSSQQSAASFRNKLNTEIQQNRETQHRNFEQWKGDSEKEQNIANLVKPQQQQKNQQEQQKQLQQQQQSLQNSQQQQQQQKQMTRSAVSFHPKQPTNAYNNNSNRKYVPKSTGYTQMQEQLKKTQTKLRSKLYFDEKTMSVPKTTLKNKVIENIVQEPKVFLSNKQLLGSVYKLKQLNLLKNHDIHVLRMPGIGRNEYVYNDFHSKSTNNGFSRNDFGGFYTR